MRQVNVAILGAGTVGGGVVDAVHRNGALMASRLGLALKVHRVVVRDARKPRNLAVDRKAISTDWRQAVADPETHIVVELVGGVTQARDMVLEALRSGKPVVTANKALLSAHGEELFAAARSAGTGLYYEASVAGGIPIIKVLREALIGNRITRAFGILNGTCNYILTRMREERGEFEAVLADAQRLGYAEAEPSLDVDGTDALHKTGILASLAHGFWVDVREVAVEGIRGITPLDMEFAEQLGYTIKLLSAIKPVDAPRSGRGAGRGRRGTVSGPRVSVTVGPTLVPNGHVLASVGGVYNAVFLRGDIVGDTLFYGRGAGREATASAVLSDLADAALDMRCGAHDRVPPFVPHERNGAVLPAGEVVSSHYLRLWVTDRPGVLARVAAILARQQIGISSVIQPEGHEGESVPLIFMLHDARRSAVDLAIRAIRRLPVVKAEPALFRVETFL
ncbi:MAG: homoserine dehydrogenase [Verrucomicrobiae bacterium]|nr:homoserine dehydrogenase [Verrucomicrobiae bacterium]